METVQEDVDEAGEDNSNTTSDKIEDLDSATALIREDRLNVLVKLEDGTSNVDLLVSS